MDAQERCYAPLGRSWFPPSGHDESLRPIAGTVNDPILIGRQWQYIDGTCEIELSPGPLTVAIAKGPEYQPVVREIALTPGKMSLRLELQRSYDPRTAGWFSGAITHMTLSPHEVLLEGEAEGLRVVDLLAYERVTTPPDGHDELLPNLIDYPNLMAFSGQRPCLETQDCLVAVNTLNRHWVLGTLALLNCHRVVFPLRVDRAHEREWTLADWCDQCHRKHGLVVSGLGAAEQVADVLLGKIDAVGLGGETLPTCQAALWQNLLALGLRLPAVAEPTDRRPLGYTRTYARLQPGQDFSYANWIEAVRAGRTLVTRGPFLTLTVNDTDPGACVEADRAGAILRVRAEAVSHTPFHEIALVRDGIEVVRSSAQLDGDRLYRAKLDAEIMITKSGWFSAMCLGRPQDGMQPVEARTSPTYVRVERQPPPVDAEAVQSITGMLERTLAWVQRDADSPHPCHRERLAKVLVDAGQRLRKWCGGTP